MMKLLASLAFCLPAWAFAAEKPYGLYHDFSLPYHQGRSMVWVVADGPSGPDAWVTVILQVNHGPSGSLVVYTRDLKRVALSNRSYPILDWAEEAGGVKKGSEAACRGRDGAQHTGIVETVLVNPMRRLYWLRLGDKRRFFEDCSPAPTQR